MDDGLSLAHLSDIHLPLTGGHVAHIHPKRLLGMINWRHRRRHQHLPSTLAAIVDDLRSQSPDHVAVTGDLVNFGLPAEHRAAARWLTDLGPAHRVTAVPGNHDIYVEMGSRIGVGHWQTYMAGDALDAAGAFPFVRRLGHIAVIGLNSAVPTPLFHAYGSLGPAQLERLGPILAALGEEGLVRVVLIHHPPLAGQAPHRCALKDTEALAEVLLRHGAELVLHGHNHRAMLAFAPGPVRPIPVVGAPSASLGLARGAQTLARYNIYRLSPRPGDPIELTERGILMPGGPVVEVSRRLLGPTPPMPAPA